jgi:hypothetical protein
VGVAALPWMYIRAPWEINLKASAGEVYASFIIAAMLKND